MKPHMGIFAIRCKLNNMCYIESTKDLKSRINSARFKLEAGSHPCRELQKEWKELGESKFTIEILENLEYDKDESKTDYSEDLALMQMIWEEKLTREGLEFYSK